MNRVGVQVILLFENVPKVAGNAVPDSETAVVIQSLLGSVGDKVVLAMELRETTMFGGFDGRIGAVSPIS